MGNWEPDVRPDNAVSDSPGPSDAPTCPISHRGAIGTVPGGLVLSLSPQLLRRLRRTLLGHVNGGLFFIELRVAR